MNNEWYFERRCAACSQHIFASPKHFGLYLGQFEWFCSDECAWTMAPKQTLVDLAVKKIAQERPPPDHLDCPEDLNIPEDLKLLLDGLCGSLRENYSKKRSAPCRCRPNCYREYDRKRNQKWVSLIEQWVRSDPFLKHYASQ
jgi:hypothetical protein